MSANKELHKLCEEVVAGLISKYRWCLLEGDDFVHIVFERANAEGKQGKVDITKIAINQYCKALYIGCTPSTTTAFYKIGRPVDNGDSTRPPEGR